MRNSCAVCSLAVTLCLVVCVSSTEKVSEEEARRAVTQATTSVTEVRGTAQTQFDNAKGLLDKVESSKRDAQEAALKSQTAAGGNVNAKAIATAIKTLSDDAGVLYSEVKEKLEAAVNILTSLLSEAQTLEGKPEIAITANGEDGDDYTETKGKATTLEGKATELNGRITTALEPIFGFDSKAGDMVKKAKEAQLKDAHVSAIVAVAKIETILGHAATTIGQIEGKKNEVSGIVGEMQKDCTTELAQSNELIKQQCQIANDALRDAQGAFRNANDARADIQKQKDTTDAALTKVQPETGEVSEAQKEVQNAEACVTTAKRIVQKLNDALQTAKDSLTSATDSQENLKRALSTATSATRPEQSLTNPKVKELQNSVSAAVSTIQSMMREADGTLQETKNNKEAVHDIVEEMKKLSTTKFIEANQNIKMLYSKADGALTDATGAVPNAEKAKTDMTQQKQKADAALSLVKTATDVNTAQKEVEITNECVNQVKQFAATLKSALQTAKDSVTKANDAKKEIKKALSTTTTAPSTFQATETEKTNHPVVDGTEPDQKDTTVQPTSKGSPDQSNNNADKFKDALINGAQNVPTTALTGGKAPAPGAKNDSAMTVSVPLLVALIASAALQ